MTWDAYHRRKDTLREMLAVADRRREDITTTELLDTVDGAREAFADETALLLDLQMAWFQRFSGQMDQLSATGAETPEMLAVTAWVRAAGEMPGARTLLDAHRDDPALAKAFAKELSYLAATAGIGSDHGRRLQETARESVVYPDPNEQAEGSTPGLLARLRSAIAA